MDSHIQGPTVSGSGVQFGSVSGTRSKRTLFAKATGTLTSDTTIPANLSTVVIAGVTYTFKTALTASTTAYEVLIGGSAANALTNLKSAINHTGTPGTDYGSLTPIDPNVTAGTLTATTLFVTSKTDGTASNAYGTTSSTSPNSHMTWGSTTLTGGKAGVSTTSGDRLILTMDGASVTNPLLLRFLEVAATAFDGTSPVVSIISTDLDGSNVVSEFAIADIAAGVFKNKVFTSNKKIWARYTAATGSPTAGDIYAFVQIVGCNANSL